MPYLEPGSAPNNIWTVLGDELASHSSQGSLRIPLVGTPQARCVLLRWLAGHVEPGHRHPRAVELFVVLSGRVRARFGDLEAVQGTVGSLFFADADQDHGFEVLGRRPLIMLAIVAPNEDAKDEALPPNDMRVVRNGRR
jgi:quercetin dioxygenase-like cupin family protein